MAISLMETDFFAPLIMKARNKNKKDYNLSFLLGRKLEQSESIRQGNTIEIRLNDLINRSSVVANELANLCNFNSGNYYLLNDKEKKFQIDTLFSIDKTLFYRELKTNPDLDSEKLPKTIEKINSIKDILEKQNLFKNIDIGIQTVWFEKEKDMNFLNKYSKYNMNIYFMNEFLSLLGISCQKEDYYKSWKNIEIKYETII